MTETMKNQFSLIKRTWGVFYLKNKISGEQKSLDTRDKVEAEKLLHTYNEAHAQSNLNLQMARVYLNASDPNLALRTWQDVMEHIVAKKNE